MDYYVIQFKLLVNGYSEKVTPLRWLAFELVALSQDEPLSVDLTMFPELATATNTTVFTEDEEELSETLVKLSEVSSEESSDDEVLCYQLK